jgi:hypothetical protein
MKNTDRREMIKKRKKVGRAAVGEHLRKEGERAK